MRRGSGTNDDPYNRTSPSLDYSKRIFLIEYPFPIVEPATYSLVFLSEELMCVVGGMFYVACDTTFAQLLTHITLQIEALRLDVEAFVDHQSSDAEQMRKLILLEQRHRKLMRLCGTLRQMYNPVIGVLVLISSVNICFNIFEMSQVRIVLFEKTLQNYQ
uniref:Odorant receptor n=1 Tax=Trichogramma kaykai TaxID=54128 RepID=A0ABD2WTA2_9HYME